MQSTEINSFQKHHLESVIKNNELCRFYQSAKKTANYISSAMVTTSIVNIFCDISNASNCADQWSFSVLLYFGSYIPMAFETFFNNQLTYLLAEIQLHIDIANLKNIVQIKTTSSEPIRFLSSGIKH